MSRPFQSSAERRAAVALACVALGACGERAEPAGAVATALQARDAELVQLRARVAQLEAELELARAPSASAPAAFEQRLAALRDELQREVELRMEREREWLRYTKAVAALHVKSIPEAVAFTPQVPAEPAPASSEPAPVDAPKREREGEILRSLRTLLAIEGVRGIDLLESGRLGEGCVGPVVFRVLDERGRLIGSLSAARLRLEGSRTARTLAVVLEDGYEMRGGVRTPFAERERLDAPPLAGGVRRLEFDGVDPLPWVNALPELFGDAVLDPPDDDGLWNASYVRGALNRLLRVDAANGYWRVRDLAGVTGGELRGVHLEGFDRDGQLERRLFADRLQITLQEPGVVLLLSDGAQMRGEEKAPFLDGRFRIFLPRAAHADWHAARLPGLAQPAGAGAEDAAADGH